MLFDLAVMAFALIVPNPLSEHDWPAATQFRFGNFSYFYVLLAGATLAYTWRTIFVVGTWTSILWVLGVIWVVLSAAGGPRPFPRVLARSGR